MANKKRRRRPRSGGDETGPPRAPSAERPNQRDRPRADRQERKQQARRAREAALRAQRRRATIRRFVASVVVAAVVVGVFVFLTRASGPNPFPEAAEEAAEAAGCSDIQQPADGDAPGGQHLEPEAAHVYEQAPATSGIHDPATLSGDEPVFTEMPQETKLVHNLEHAFVNIYYRAEGESALPQEVVDELAGLAEADPQRHTILSPHTSLPEGTDLAFTAWDQLLTCPGSVTAPQARTIAEGFATAFKCTGNAPEPNASDGC